MGGRFLTFNSVIRVNQIEVTRNDNAGVDEYKHHTPQNVEAKTSRPCAMPLAAGGRMDA